MFFYFQKAEHCQRYAYRETCEGKNVIDMNQLDAILMCRPYRVHNFVAFGEDISIFNYNMTPKR